MKVAPAMFGVATLLRIVTDCDCEERTPVAYACIVEADVAVSWPLELSWARTQGSGGDPSLGCGPICFAPATVLRRAWAKMYRLPLVPTCAAGGETWAVALEVVGVIVLLTV